MNQDPTQVIEKSVFERLKERAREITIVTTLTAVALAGCSDDDNGNEVDLDTNSDAVTAMCDVEPLALDEYQAVIGTGPFAPIEAALADRVDIEEVRNEAAEEVANNTLGSAFFNTLINNDNAAYQVSDIYTKTIDDFNNALGNEELRESICQNVVGNLLQNSEIKEFSTADLVRFFNQYDNDVIAGLDFDDDASARDTISVLGVPDRNGNIIGGIVMDSEYAGEFIIEKRIGENVSDIQEDADVFVQPTEEGEVEAPVTIIVTPEGREIPVVINPETGEPVAVNPETGEPTGEPIPEGSVPKPNEGGEGADNEGTDNGTGEGDNGSGDGTTGGGANGEDSGDNGAGDGTDGGGGGSCDDGCGTGGGTTTSVKPVPTTTGPHPTTTVRPTTTTSPHPTTTVRPTTTTTVKPTTTTTTVKPTTTTSTTTTTVKPTTTTSTTTTTTTEVKDSPTTVPGTPN